jgi:hypothetical protein
MTALLGANWLSTNYLHHQTGRELPTVAVIIQQQEWIITNIQELLLYCWSDYYLYSGIIIIIETLRNA